MHDWRYHPYTTNNERRMHYYRMNGCHRLTNRQQRRLVKKLGHSYYRYMNRWSEGE
jgi:uncharacterized ParB-like nuclease family protein